MFSYSSLSDEELLLEFRSGNEDALAHLMDRIFAMRKYSCLTASPTSVNILDEWEQNEMVHHSFYIAVRSYEFHQARFLTFYHAILKKSLSEAVTKKLATAPGGIISMDQFVEYGEGGYVLHDCIPSESEIDDPRVFLNYAEVLMDGQKLPKGIDSNVVTLVELISQGYSIPSAARILGIEVHRARYMIRKYREWAMSTEKKVYSYSEVECQEKEKLLDEFLHWGNDEE